MQIDIASQEVRGPRQRRGTYEPKLLVVVHFFRRYSKTIRRTRRNLRRYGYGFEPRSVDPMLQ